MADKSDALRERYQRFSDGDLEGAPDLWSDDFVWEGANATELPGSGRHEGKQAAIEVLQQAVGKWGKFELSADEFVEQGDTVVVLRRTDLANGGQSQRLPAVHIWRYRGDEEICRLQSSRTHSRARASSSASSESPVRPAGEASRFLESSGPRATQPRSSAPAAHASPR